MILTGVFTPRGNALADTNITSNISANTTWTTAGGTYIIQNTIAINSGVTLTVDPGVVVKFKATSTALYVNGILKAEGTATSSIYFTSYKDDTVGGDTDGVTAPVQAGNWDAISTASGATTTLKYATVRYGGGGYTAYTLYNNGGKLDIQNSVIDTSRRYGISHSSGNTIIATTTINSNGEYGVKASLSSGSVSITNSTFYDNALAAGTFNFGSGLVLTNSGNTNSTTGSGKRGFIMTGSVNANTTWTADGLPYIISGGFAINSGKTLTVNPGTVVKFENNMSYLQVGGTLNAIGDSTHQIYFTSIKDDVLNDTDASATTTPSAGDWRHITVSSATANFSYATIRYGGGDAYDHANLANNSGTYNISSSTISNASYYGIYHGSGTTNLTQSSLFGNGVRAYHNAGYATTTATNNYWGDLSGPYNLKYNWLGQGNAVSDYVTFWPWFGQTNYIWPDDGSVEWDILHGHEIRWGGTTQYSTAWENAVDTWNARGSVLVAPDDIWHYERLTVSDIDNPNVPWAALYSDYLNVPFNTDTIEFNSAKMMSTLDGQTNTCTHELGHALRLDHSYIGNIMYFQQTLQTALGTQDISDYDSLW